VSTGGIVSSNCRNATDAAHKDGRPLAACGWLAVRFVCRLPTRYSSGDVLGRNAHPRCGVDGGELPGHGHGAGVGGIVGHEVHGLHNSNTGDQLNEARFDDVRRRRGLTPDGSRRAPIRWHVATVRDARAESPTA
jgi:hypothetical protein